MRKFLSDLLFKVIALAHKFIFLVSTGAYIKAKTILAKGNIKIWKQRHGSH